MDQQRVAFALIADRHHGLSEGIRSLLEPSFDAVLMVADEASLVATMQQVSIDLTVIDLALVPERVLSLIGRLRDGFPQTKIVALSNHDQQVVSDAALKAGADAFVVKRAIATDLPPVVDRLCNGHVRSRNTSL